VAAAQVGAVLLGAHALAATGTAISPPLPVDWRTTAHAPRASAPEHNAIMTSLTPELTLVLPPLPVWFCHAAARWQVSGDGWTSVVYDSGDIPGTATNHILREGLVKPGGRYAWRARLLSAQGAVTPWTAPAQFEIAPWACACRADAACTAGMSVGTLTALTGGGVPQWYGWDIDGDGAADVAGPGESSIALAHPDRLTQPVRLTVSNIAGAVAHARWRYAAAAVHNEKPFPPLALADSGRLTADFSTPACTGVAPWLVQFHDASSATASAWSWDLNGDSVPDATAQFPAYLYATAGTYHVTLTVQDARGGVASCTRREYLHVWPPVAAHFTAEPPVHAVGAPVTLRDCSPGQPCWWSWSSPAMTGWVCHVQHPVVRFTAPGFTTLQLTVSNRFGASTTIVTNAIKTAGATPWHFVSPAGRRMAPYTNWDTAATCVQPAIDAADPYDTIMIAPGTYRARGTPRDGTNLMVLEKPVDIIGVGNPVLDGGGRMRCAWLAAGSITGVRFVHGNASGGGGAGRGGGVLCAGPVLITNCASVNCAAQEGGGAWIDGGALLTGCAITGNHAHIGGGLVLRAGSSVDAVQVAGNHACVAGGGAYLPDGATLVAAQVYNNQAPVFPEVYAALPRDEPAVRLASPANQQPASSLPAMPPCIARLQVAARPASSLLDVWYDVAGGSGEYLKVTALVSTNGGRSYTVKPRACHGAGYGMIRRGAGQWFAWDAREVCDGARMEAVRLLLCASDAAVPPGMCYVPPGPFAMGDSYHEGWPPELPVHPVAVAGFFMDQHEVPKTLWDTVRSWAWARGYDFANNGFAIISNHPVNLINWYDCVKWCNARSELEGLPPVYFADERTTHVYRTGQALPMVVCWNAPGYRLPTEAEWEKAARGGLPGHHYPWPSRGGNWSNHVDGGMCNYWHSDDPFDNGTTPCGFYNGRQFPPGDMMTNGFGLCDMAGNVWEWCWDWYDAAWYAQAAATNANTRGPGAGRPLELGLGEEHTGQGTCRVLRGGAWRYKPRFHRCAFRNYALPFLTMPFAGFRCVRAPDP
jgi:formylglycine-generating enzyme required for sulfatase activity/PKD repeat protein